MTALGARDSPLERARAREGATSRVIAQQSVAADNQPAVAPLRGLPWRLPLNANVGQTL